MSRCLTHKVLLSSPAALNGIINDLLTVQWACALACKRGRALRLMGRALQFIKGKVTSSPGLNDVGSFKCSDLIPQVASGNYSIKLYWGNTFLLWFPWKHQGWVKRETREISFRSFNTNRSKTLSTVLMLDTTGSHFPAGALPTIDSRWTKILSSLCLCPSSFAQLILHSTYIFNTAHGTHLLHATSRKGLYSCYCAARLVSNRVQKGSAVKCMPICSTIQSQPIFCEMARHLFFLNDH